MAETRNQLTMCRACGGLGTVLMKNPAKDLAFYETTEEDRLSYFEALERWTTALKDPMTRTPDGMPDHCSVRCSKCGGSGLGSITSVLRAVPSWLFNGFREKSLDHFFGGRAEITFRNWCDTFYRRDAVAALLHIKEILVKDFVNRYEKHYFEYNTEVNNNRGVFRVGVTPNTELKTAYSRQALIDLCCFILSDMDELTDAFDEPIKAPREHLMAAARCLILEAHRRELFEDTADVMKALGRFDEIPFPIYKQLDPELELRPDGPGAVV